MLKQHVYIYEILSYAILRYLTGGTSCCFCFEVPGLAILRYLTRPRGTPILRYLTGGTSFSSFLEGPAYAILRYLTPTYAPSFVLLAHSEMTKIQLRASFAAAMGPLGYEGPSNLSSECIQLIIS